MTALVIVKCRLSGPRTTASRVFWVIILLKEPFHWHFLPSIEKHNIVEYVPVPFLRHHTIYAVYRANSVIGETAPHRYVPSTEFYRLLFEPRIQISIGWSSDDCFPSVPKRFTLVLSLHNMLRYVGRSRFFDAKERRPLMFFFDKI